MGEERDVEAGLPQNVFRPISVEHFPRHKPSPPCREVVFKAYVTGSALVIWSLHALLMRATLAGTRPSERYYATTVVFLAESLKWLICVVFLARQAHWSPGDAIAEIKSVLRRSGDMAKCTVPSVLYTIQNNLDFVALANIEPSVFVVSSQLKVVTTAVLMMVLLGRRFSLIQWLSLLGLMGGVALVQLDSAATKDAVTAVPDPNQNYALGMGAVIAACFTSAFAGVWFERMLKTPSQEVGFWARNLQLYTSGALLAGLACAIGDGQGIARNGFFHGYTPATFLIIALTSGGGIYVSLIMKHLDNILKTFTNALSILAVVAGSVLFLGASVGAYFVLGGAVVLSALVAYNLNPPKSGTGSPSSSG